MFMAAAGLNVPDVSHVFVFRRCATEGIKKKKDWHRIAIKVRGVASRTNDKNGNRRATHLK
jgi:hypothetical protein